MELDDSISLEHLLFQERQCRTCGIVKDLMDGFYLIRKERGDIPSSYSYECKVCTISRITASRMTNRIFDRWEYPDW